MRRVAVGFLFLVGVFLLPAQAQQSVIKAKLNEQVTQMVNTLNSYPNDLRKNAQNHFDNSVRTLTESLRQFSLAANMAPYAVAETKRADFQACLVGIRDTMEDVLMFLRMRANSQVFDFSVSTETRIEIDLKPQINELLTAIASKTNDTCLQATGITTKSLFKVYEEYRSKIKSCISSISSTTNNEIIAKFNPEHFPALSFLNQIRRSLEGTKTHAHIISFMDYYCKPDTIRELNDVKTSAEDVMTATVKGLDYCYDKNQSLIPKTNPYIPLANKCE